VERRAFLQTLAAVMALPAYRTARLIEDFGLPAQARVVIRRRGNYLVMPHIVAREALTALEANLMRANLLHDAVKPGDGLQ
jgi:3-phenylpropionate/cinnamic acid dioxygenase small subunit